MNAYHVNIFKDDELMGNEYKYIYDHNKPKITILQGIDILHN